MHEELFSGSCHGPREKLLVWWPPVNSLEAGSPTYLRPLGLSVLSTRRGGGEQEGSGACCSSEAQSSGVQLRPPTQKMLPAAGREAPGSTSHGGADYQLVIEGVLGSGVESEEEVLG